MDNPLLIKNKSLTSNRSLINNPSLINNQSLTKEPRLSSHFSATLVTNILARIAPHYPVDDLQHCALLQTVALCSRNNVTNIRLPCRTSTQQLQLSINLLRKEPAFTPLQVIVNTALIINDSSDAFTATTN